MPTLLRNRLFGVWLLLVVVTLLSSTLGGSGEHPIVHNPMMITIAVLSIAFAKAWLVMYNYMDVRGAPFALRMLCSGWLVLVLAVLLAIYSGFLHRVGLS